MLYCCHQSPLQGAVTLVTMALPVMCSLLALLRMEHHRRAQAERLQQDRGALAQQTRLLEDGQPLSISQDAMQARRRAGPPLAEAPAPALVPAGAALASRPPSCPGRHSQTSAMLKPPSYINPSG